MVDHSVDERDLWSADRKVLNLAVLMDASKVVELAEKLVVS